MVKTNIRDKIKKVLGLKISKIDSWTTNDMIAWKNFCLTTPGLIHLANKIPSEVTLDSAVITTIDNLYNSLKEEKKTKKESTKEKVDSKKKKKEK